MPDIEISATGPLFRAAERAGITREFVREAVDDITAQAYADVMGNLNASIRHPTPYYETQVTNERVSEDSRRVHDRGVIYGPWLEGTGSRNRTTRFRGYASFRRARQSVQARVPELVSAALARCVDRLGG